MLILTNPAGTADKIRLITGQAADIDVVASYIGLDNAHTINSEGRQCTTITTATTTDIVSGPGTTGHIRNVKHINMRNAHASASCDCTVVIDLAGTQYEMIKITLAAGDTLEFVEGVGWFKVPNPVAVPGPNVSTADQAVGASVTNYLTNSDLHISAGRPLRVGTVIRWHITFSKTAAATASMTFDMRVGTAGTTGDTSRASLATGAQTGVVDNGELEVACTVRSISATGVLETSMQMEHNLAATGLAPTNVVTSAVNSGAAVDTTSTALIFGMSLTTGALHAITIRRVVAEFLTGTI